MIISLPDEFKDYAHFEEGKFVASSDMSEEMKKRFRIWNKNFEHYKKAHIKMDKRFKREFYRAWQEEKLVQFVENIKRFFKKK